MAWILDLDGVVWLSREPIPGATEAVARLREAGERVLFVTNASTAPIATVVSALAAIGIPAEGDVISSAMAAAHMLDPGSSALVCGGAGVVEALIERGVEVLEAGPVDAVVVGLTRELTYDLLHRVSAAVRGGARFIATNTDPVFPTPEGLTPGGGSIVAAVATASRTEPEVAGKPHQAMADLVLALAGEGPHVMVGDQAATDLAFGRVLGARTVLVLTGVTSESQLPVDPAPDEVAADLGSFVTAELAARS